MQGVRLVHTHGNKTRTTNFVRPDVPPATTPRTSLDATRSPRTQAVMKTDSTLALIICHRHPRMKGSMDNPVVQAVYRAAVQSRGFNTVMAYNQRGVDGTMKSLRGGPDMHDIPRLCTFLTELPDPPSSVYIVG